MNFDWADGWQVDRVVDGINASACRVTTSQPCSTLTKRTRNGESWQQWFGYLPVCTSKINASRAPRGVATYCLVWSSRNRTTSDSSCSRQSPSCSCWILWHVSLLVWHFWSLGPCLSVASMALGVFRYQTMEDECSYTWHHSGVAHRSLSSKWHVSSSPPGAAN